MTTQVEEPTVEILTESDILAVLVPKGQGPTTAEPVSVAKRRFDSLIAEQLTRFTGQANAMLAAAQGCTIQTPEDYEAAATRLKETKTLWKTMEDGREVFSVPLNAILRHVNGTIKGVQEIVTKAEKRWKTLLDAWSAEQERLRREAQARLDEAARVEQKRLQDLADKRAERAEAKGDTTRAQEIRESVPVVTPATVVLTEVPKVKGISYEDFWTYEITNANALLTAAAAGEIPAEVFEINHTYVRKAVEGLGTTLQWPGIRIWGERRIKSGRA